MNYAKIPSKPFWITLIFLFVVISLGIRYGQNIWPNESVSNISTSIAFNIHYGESDIYINQEPSYNISTDKPVTRIDWTVNFGISNGDTIESVTGIMNLTFDGVLKKTAQLTSPSGTITINSTEIDEWDNGNYTRHQLNALVISGTVTLRKHTGISETVHITQSSRNISIVVLAPKNVTKTIKVTIDHTKIENTLTDFPLMIHFTSTSPILKQLNQNNNTRISISQGNQQLFVEIETWNSSDAILWVKVPSISATVDTVLTITYGSSMDKNMNYVGDTLSATTPNVWSNGYVSVFHLNGNTYDSASARNNGIIQGGVTWVTGPLNALCARFDGSTGVILVPDNPKYSSVNNDDKLTEECWLSPERINWSDYISPLGKGRINEHETKWNLDGGSKGAWKFYILNAAGSYGSGARSSPVEPPYQAPLRTANDWFMLHGQVIGDQIALYEGPGIPGQGTHGVGGDINQLQGWNDYTKGEGVPDGNPIIPSDTTSPFYIGRYGGYQPEWQSQDVVPLKIYEVRISSVNRSISWMKADYYNQIDQLVTIN